MVYIIVFSYLIRFVHFFSFFFCESWRVGFIQDRQFDLISKTLVLYNIEIGEKKITILPKLVTHTHLTHTEITGVYYIIYTLKSSFTVYLCVFRKF